MKYFVLTHINLKFTSIGMVKLSVVIITFNEEENIGRCIDSVRSVADEVIVIDSYSSDKTREICIQKRVRLVEHQFVSHIDQKNFAISQSHYDHVLSLDADEYLSDLLCASIISAKESWTHEAYAMNRLSNFGGIWIKHGSWYPDRKIRLWNKKYGKWGGENPHDKVVLNKGVKVKRLKGDILHNAYRDVTATLVKIQKYSDIFAHENAGIKKSSIFRIGFHSTFALLKSYFLKGGFRDGFAGLMVATIEGSHTFYKYAKLYELNQQRSIGKKIIICRSDNLGDVVVTLPVAGFLKRFDPSYKIYFIGKKYTRPIINGSQYVDEFLDREELLKNPEMLRSIGADTILFVYPDLMLARLAQKVKIPNRVGTGHRWYNWIYCNKLVYFSRQHSDFHESLLNFNLLRPFKISERMDMSDLPALYGLQAMPINFSHLLSGHQFNLIIHPKSKGSAREWGLENYENLIASLPDDFKIFITGLKEEGDAIRSERPSLLADLRVTDLTGKMNLKELISFIQQADGLLACSTGVLHIAAALGKYTLGIYSPMRPIHPGRWKPVGDHADYLVLNKNCHDCKRSLQCACIAAITVSQVKSRLELFKEQSIKQVVVN